MKHRHTKVRAMSMLDMTILEHLPDTIGHSGAASGSKKPKNSCIIAVLAGLQKNLKITC